MLYIMIFFWLILSSIFISLVLLKKFANLPWCICFLCNIACSILLVILTFCFLINADVSYGFHEAIYEPAIIYTILGLQTVNCLISLFLFIFFLFFEAKTY